MKEQKGNVYKAFSTSKEAEEKGIIIAYDEAFAFKVARANASNDAYAKRLAKLSKPYLRAIKNETISRKKQRELLIRSYYGTVVLGWEGVEGEDGAPLEFNEQNMVKLFTDLPDLFDDIMEQSNKAFNFRQSTVEEAEGN